MAVPHAQLDALDAAPLDHLNSLHHTIRKGLASGLQILLVAPPMVALYHRPRTVLEVVDHTVGKVLDLFGIEHQLFRRWDGPPPDSSGLAGPSPTGS